MAGGGIVGSGILGLPTTAKGCLTLGPQYAKTSNYTLSPVLGLELQHPTRGMCLWSDYTH